MPGLDPGIHLAGSKGRFLRNSNSAMIGVVRSSTVATMISEVYDAFIAAGAPEEKARKAAEAIASYENRFARIVSDLAVLKWMTGTILAGVVALVIKTFFA
jgi:hypothetical protein